MTEVDGRYAVINTQLNVTEATLVESMSGRQGDDGRIVYFSLRDGQFPHNLTGQDVSLEIKDSIGKIKVIHGFYDMVSIERGLFSMLIPSQFYQAAGDIEEGYLKVTDATGIVITSVPITFSVRGNGVILTANASQDFIDTIEKIIKEADKQIADLNGRIEPQKLAITTLQQSIDEATALINAKQVATQNSANDFTANNTFEKDVTVKGAIRGKSDSAIIADSIQKTARLDNLESVHSVDIKLLGGTLSLYRAGNIISVASNIKNSMVVFKQYAQIAPTNTVPVGYRPIAFTGTLNLHQADWLENRESGQIVLELDGSITTKNTFNKNTTEASDLEVFGSYVTNDDMPRN